MKGPAFKGGPLHFEWTTTAAPENGSCILNK